MLDPSDNRCKASDSLMHRLEREAAQLIDNLGRETVAVGDAEFVRYDEEWAREHGIGRFGRMTKNGGQYTFHAGPIRFDRRPKYEMPDENVISYVRAWENGTAMSPPVSKLCHLDGVPKLKEPKRTYSISEYERNLFSVVGKETDVTLINPGFGTMRELATSVGGYVYLTGQPHEQWYRDIVDFVANSGKRLRMTREIRGHAYLGTNVPKYFPTTPWTRFVISPFVDVSTMFTSSQVSWTDAGIVSTYVKKDKYEVLSVLERSSPHYVYSPGTVDAGLLGKRGRQLMFLESSHDLKFKPVEDNKVRHTPWYVMGGGDWVMLEGKRWKIRNKQVTDVEGPGTYFSRRAREGPPSGYEWVPILSTGTHWITLTSNVPHRLPGVQHNYQIRDNGEMSNIYSFDNLQMIEGLHVVYSTREVFYFSGKMPVGGDVSTLKGDSGLFRSQGGVVQSGTTVHARILKDRSENYYLISQARDTGILLEVDERIRVRPFPFLPCGVLRHFTWYETERGDFVDVRQSSATTIFMFKNRVAVTHLAAVFSAIGPWMGFENTGPMEKGPAGAEVAANHVSVSISNILKAREIGNINCESLTAVEISQRTALPIHVVSHYCANLPFIHIWKGYGEKYTQFVHEDSLGLRQSGTPTDVEMNGIRVMDGLSWRELLHRIKFGRTRKLVSTSSVRDISTFFET